MINKKKGFTLIEIMMGLLILSLVILASLYGISVINIWKVRLIETANLEKEAFYSSETLFEFIKKGWVIDYEEYLNRKNYDSWLSASAIFDNGHFQRDTWFWNGTTSMYYCVSKSWTKMYPRAWTASWCLDDFNTNTGSLAAVPAPQFNVSRVGSRLLYGQYQYQFIDFNSDADGNSWDENGNQSILRDDDDQYNGNGPWVFQDGARIYELYLLSWDGKKRTFLRWNVITDPNAPTTASNCTGFDGIPSNISWEKCLWNLEYLKLEWVDWWYDHDSTKIDPTQFDGIIDTWIYDKATYGLTTDIKADNTTAGYQKYRVPLFPSTMNVQQVKFYLYPYKDPNLSWKDTTPQVNVNPYLRMQISLTPSRLKRKWLRWTPPVFTYGTTISLTDIFSK